MRAKIILTVAAIALTATPALAQTTIKKIIEPVAPTVDDIINAPIEYTDQGVVKAQYFKADDLSEAEYQALLEEADRVRAYQAANGGGQVVFDTPATTYTPAASYAPTTTYETATTYSSPTTTYAAPTIEHVPATTTYSQGYQVDVYEPATSYQAVESAKIHTIAKGETLYAISKLYGADVEAIKAENGISGTLLSIGQQIRIPNVVSSSLNTTQTSSTVLQPIFASAPVRDGVVTRRVVQKTPEVSSPVIASGTQIYAVLRKDTLSSISRMSCVPVKDLIAANRIVNPDSLQPGQRLTLPAGHCLAK